MAEKAKILDIQINTSDAVKRMQALEKSIESLTEQMGELLVEEKDGQRILRTSKKLQGEEREAYEKMNAQVKNYKQQITTIQKQIRNQIKVEEENLGSIVALRAELSNLNRQYDELSKEDREEGILGQKYLDRITEVNKQLTIAEEKSGRFQRNVGNYYGSIMNAAEDLLFLKRNDGSGGGGGASDMGAGASTESLRREKKELTELQQQMKLAGLEGTKEFQDIADAIGECKDVLGDLEQETTHYASDTAKLDEVRAGFDATQDAVSGVSSTLNTLGVESEHLQNIEQKLGSSVSAVNSFISVQNALQKQSALMLGIKRIQQMAATKAQQTATKSTIAATIAQKALNAVANANPYVLLATAILTVVGAIAAFATGSEIAEKKYARLNDELERGYNLFNQQRRGAQHEDRIRVIRKEMSELEALEKDIKRVSEKRDALAKQEKEAALHIYDFFNSEKKKEFHDNIVQQYDELGTELENLKDRRDEIKAERDMQAKEDELQAQREYEDAVLELERESFDKQVKERKLQAKREQEDLKYRRDTDKSLNEHQIEAINKQILASEKRLNADLIRMRREHAREQGETLREEQRKAQDLLIKNIKDYNERVRAEENAEYSRQLQDLMRRLKTDINLSPAARKEIYKQIEQLTIAHSRNLLNIENEAAKKRLELAKENYELQIEALDRNYDQKLLLQMKALQAEREIELANAELTEEEKALIRKKYAQAEVRQRRETLKEKQEYELEAYNLAAENELLALRVRNANSRNAELEELELTAKQSSDAFANMRQMELETDAEYRNRILQAQLKAVEDEKALTQKKREIQEKQIEGYKEVTNAMLEVAGAATEGTRAEEDLKKVSSALGIVTGGLAMAQSIEKASQASTWYEAIAEVAATVAAFAPIISNIKQLAGYAEGGYVSGAGSGTSDSINARLSNGEYVMRASAVNSNTLPFLNALNYGAQTSAEVGNNNFIAQQMALALRSMPAPIVSVVDINKGQNRVKVIDNSRRMF